ncbi:MAG: hypothetical protein LC667_07000 [Thioalkalivibrio sp.]|nr:hypothetical protein [Thioalkalivibrio sp.]
MNLAEAEEIYEAIQETQFTSLADALVTAGVRYARIRTDYKLATVEKRGEMEDTRTRSHTAFIDCCNILSRNMAKAGENNAWRNKLGDDRKLLGDFACHLHCLLGIAAR